MNERMTVENGLYRFGMPRMDWSEADETSLDLGSDPTGGSDPKTLTIEELRAENEKFRNIFKTHNKKINRLSEDLQKKTDAVKQYEEEQQRIKAETEQRLQKQGEWEPLLQQTKDELERERAARIENERLLSERTQQMARHKIETALYLKLFPKIRPDWTKKGDPVKEAIGLYPVDKLTIDETTGEPTNEEEITKEFLETYPLLEQTGQTIQNGAGAIIGPGSQKKADIPLGQYGAEVLLIADKEFLPASTVHERLTGPQKATWEHNWRHYLQKSKRNKVFA